MNVDDFIAVTILVFVIVFCVCFFIAWAWEIVFLIRSIRAANRMGALRHGSGKCPDFGMRLANRRTSAAVKLLLLMHAYVHHDKRIRSFGEFALRFLCYQPRLVFAAALTFEAMFLFVALICLLGIGAAILALPDFWLIGALCLILSIVIVPVFLHTVKANRRHERQLARLLMLADRLKRKRLLCP